MSAPANGTIRRQKLAVSCVLAAVARRPTAFSTMPKRPLKTVELHIETTTPKHHKHPRVKGKRKLSMATPAKFYAVRTGRVPGVYGTWEECQAQTSGFKGASYKSFATPQEAHNFAAGRPTSNAAPSKFYAVAVGNRPGVYTDWTLAQEAFTGAKGAKYRKFDTHVEAEEFVRSFNQNALDDARPEKLGLFSDGEDEFDLFGDEADELDVDAPSAKRAKLERPNNGPLVIYTDGSSRKNGKSGARAGVGVFFGPGDRRNLSERLEGEVQTNQRAELTALLRALQVADAGRDVEIRTDSKYSILCVTEWYVNWQKNNWMTSSRGPVMNKDLVQAIRGEIGAREGRGARTRIQWVKGHASDPGNIAADRLAVAGARI